MVQEALPGLDKLATREITPQTLIEMVAASGDVDKLAALLDLKIKWEQHENKKKFDHALELFRSNKTVIEKTHNVKYPNKDGSETISYWHAELDKAADIVTDALMAVGLTYTWEPDATADGKPKMSLIMRGFGHTERMGGMVGPPDLSGGKNAMQAVGSSMSYLARYSLLFSLGIVTKGKDDDGRMATGGMSDQAIDEYCQTIKDAGSIDEAKEKFAAAWKATDGDKQARDRVKTVWEEKKKKHWEAKRG